MQQLIKCLYPGCGKLLLSINNWHLKVHNISVKEYKNMFPNAEIYSKQSKYKMGCSTRGKKRTEFSKKITGSGNGMFKKNHKHESIEKMRKNRKGKAIGKTGKYKRTADIKLKIKLSVEKFNLENPGRTIQQKIEKNFCRGKSGTYRSRFGKTFRYRSLWELIVMVYFDLHPIVESWCYEPFKISYKGKYKIRTYTPDFYVDFSGVEEMWEIKPKRFLKEQINKVLLLNNLEIQKKYSFDQARIITEDEISIIKNINWEKLYFDYGFTNHDLQQRIQEMKDTVKINGVYCNTFILSNLED